jgi:hypothetical protein
LVTWVTTQLVLVTQGVETVFQPPVNASELSSTQAAPLFVHVSDTTFVPFNDCNPEHANAGGFGAPTVSVRLAKPDC